MNQELHHVQNPWHSRFIWLLVYIGLLASAIIVLVLMVGRVRTYSLPAGSVELRVPYSKYLVGEVISFTVKNNFNSPIQVTNSCPAEPLSVYRLEGKTWVRIHQNIDIRDCADDERNVTIPANRSMTATFARWNKLFATPGTYRVVAQVQYYNALPYQQFEVMREPAATQQTPPTTQRTNDRTIQNINTNDDRFENEQEDDD